MSRPRGKQIRRGRPAGPKAYDVWQAPPALPDLKPVSPTTDPTALLRSLGDPPLSARGLPVEEYMYRVVVSASFLATEALLRPAGLLVDRPDER